MDSMCKASRRVSLGYHGAQIALILITKCEKKTDAGFIEFNHL